MSNYLISTVAPASSSCFLIASASSFLTPSLTAFGAPSTKSLASFKPKPVIVLTSLRTAIFLSAAEAKALATIPSKEEIYAKMLGCVNSPATGIVGSINAVMASLTRAVAAVRDQKSA